ncbi:hypothetical protein DFH08DRAFT_961721 [Mycena albidolilacea]|uniref:Uncharacterized protein n=1 Tax=Mycena albidolilacea TaxID=1033008 RepID=A0AAD6ZYY7_9AGAR|nr:hypothetical protein DFH08DRAFT_961721 [Mycena albidolilacea]
MPPAAVKAKAKRAVTASAKATRAGDIAAAEALEDEAEPVKKKRGRPKKKKAEETPVSELIQEDTATDSKDEIDVEWTLVTAIESDEATRDSFFPGVGAIKLNGGTPKTHFHYQLAITCFADHPFYEESFEPAGAKFWRGKIKNRIGALVLKAKDNMAAMGETGAGIESEAEIGTGTALSTKWDLIKSESPWFFNMRTLIVARPNLRPVGLGNNETEIDTSILLRTNDADADADDIDTSSNGVNDADDTSTALDDIKDGTRSVEPNSDSDDELPAAGAIVAGALKRPRATSSDGPKEKQRAVKKTRPQTATSVPATAAPVKKLAKTQDKFAAIVLAEEETTQRALGLKREKVKGQTEVQLAKIRAEADLKIAKQNGDTDRKRRKRESKTDLSRLRMEQEHQYRMAQLQSRAGPSTFAGSATSSSHHADSLSGFDDSGLPLPGFGGQLYGYEDYKKFD